MSRSKRRFGDRKDGRLLRSIAPFNKFIPYIMPERVDRQNFYEESFEVSELDRRLRALRVEGYKGIGVLHFLIAAYIRCVSMMPGINRFIASQTYNSIRPIVDDIELCEWLTIDEDEYYRD